jgi:hypothetical protein
VSLEAQLAHRGVHEGLGREKKKQVKEKIIKLGSDLKNQRLTTPTPLFITPTDHP